MIESVFVIALAFTSWDSCWDAWHANEFSAPGSEVAAVCTEVTLDAPIRPQARPLAPSVSVRPQARPLAPVVSLRPQARPTKVQN